MIRTPGNASAFEHGTLLDAEASLAWLKALVTAARKLRVPMVAMFVSRGILNQLKRARGAKRDDPVFRKLKVVSGHGSHVHVRVGANIALKRRSIDELIK